MENLIFSFQVTKNNIENFRGTLPLKFKTPQELWEEIKLNSDLENYELEETELDVFYNVGKVTIDEIVNDPIEDSFTIVFE